jgi:hypothetical protein
LLGALLILLASALMQQSRATLSVSNNGVEEVIADALLTAAMEVSASRLTEASVADGTTKTLSFTDGSVEVTLLDMNGLVDLNRSPPQLIEALAAAAGDRRLAKVILARRGQPGDPLEAPWRAREEPADAPGVDPAFVALASDYATVFGTTGAINPMTAPSAVLVLLPRVSRATADQIIRLRERDPDKVERIVGLLAAGAMISATPAGTLDVFLEARTDDGFTKTVRATVLLEATSGTYRILDWQPWAVKPAWVRNRTLLQP